MNPNIGIFEPVTIMLLLGFPPRKPYVIHAHMNKMFMKVFVSIDLGLALVFLPAKAGLEFNVSSGMVQKCLSNTGIHIRYTLIMVYVLYWSHPFSHNRTEVKAVDEAVERYKKPKEGIVDLWVPALVVNGERYRNAYYVSRKKREWIVVERTGQGAGLTR